MTESALLPESVGPHQTAPLARASVCWSGLLWRLRKTGHRSVSDQATASDRGVLRAKAPPELSAVKRQNEEEHGERLFESIALGPFETVYADPLAASHRSRSSSMTFDSMGSGIMGSGIMGSGIMSFGRTISGGVSLANHFSAALESLDSPFKRRPVQEFLVRNIDSGEVRSCKGPGVDAAFVGKVSGPLSLAGSSVNRVWESWWQQKRQKDDQMWAAAADGDCQRLRAAITNLSEGSPAAQLDSVCEKGFMVLHHAASAGSVNCVDLLLQAQADLHGLTSLGLTALHVACSHGRTDVVQMLLAQRANVCAVDVGGSLPVHLAAANGHAQVVLCLLKVDGETQLSARNSQGRLPTEAALDIDTSAAFESHHCTDDGYCRRTPLHDLSILLRNSRADAVERLLFSMRDGTAALNSAHEDEVPTVQPAVCKPKSELARDSISTREPFARVWEDKAPTMEIVGPDSFVLIKLLGRGSFGEVFRVAHRETAQEYAMKVLHKEKMSSGNVLRYAFTERNVLSYISHPYIVSLFYAFQTPSHLVLILELCPGGSLQSLIAREGRLSEPLACLYSAEVLSALLHLHERRTVFRDLKPDNVVLDECGHAMLTDFGLSKEGVDGLGGAGSFCGSMAFIAPEILQRGGHGHAVDIYGLGVLLFAMLTGKPPFYHRDRETLVANIKFALLLVPSYVSKDAASLIRGVMHRDPSRRLGAACTADLQAHIFFYPIDWDALTMREIAVPENRADAALVSNSYQQVSPLHNITNLIGTPESPFAMDLGCKTPKAEANVLGWDFTTPRDFFATPRALFAARRSA